MSNIKSIFLKNLKVSVVLLTFFQILIIPIDILITQVFASIIDFVTSGNVDSTQKLVCYAVISIIAKLFIQLVGNSLIRKILVKKINACKISVLALVLNNPTYKLFKSDHGETTENLNDDLNNIICLYTEAYPAIISSIVKIICFIIYLCISSWIVAISLIFISLIQIIPPIVVKKYLKENYDNCRNIESDITNHIIEAIDGFEVIKLYNLKSWWMNKMQIYHEIYADIGRKSEATATIQRSMYSMISSILTYGTYILLGLYAMLKVCSLSMAWEGIYSSNFLYSSVKIISESIPTIVVSRVAKQRLNIWQENSYETDDTRVPVYDLIKISNVTQSYEDICIFDNVSLELDLKKKYLFKGANGEGKTTLLNLMLGLVLPDKGEINLGNKEPRFFDNAIFPTILFYIPQNIPEFNFDLEIFLELLPPKKQGDFIRKLEELGVENLSIQGKKFNELSGGERKKFLLALAISLDPQLLIIDEPSNSLDENGIKKLCDFLKGRERGFFIISHDKKYDDIVDKVYTVKDKGVHYEKKSATEICL